MLCMFYLLDFFFNTLDKFSYLKQVKLIYYIIDSTNLINVIEFCHIELVIYDETMKYYSY